MDSDLENKCENLMNIVVETRKHYGKMCTEYAKKTSTVENLLMNLQIKTFSNCNFKKQQIPAFQLENYEDLDDFTVELMKRSKRIEDLKKKVKNTQEVVFQLKTELKTNGHKRRMLEPVTADVLLARAKNKEVFILD